MKKIILLALCWPLCSYPIYAQKEQKEKTKNNSREIIIIKSGDKEKKLTIETKDGEVFINGKPSSEYKDDDVNVIRQKFRSDGNFLYTPRAGNIQVFDNKWDAEKRAFLGVTTEKADDGVKITDISSGSAAEKAGLKEGDVITKVGDKKITEPDELMDAVTKHKPKEDVTISYKREGKTNDTKATLGETGFSKSFSFNSSGIGDRDFNFTMPKINPIPREPFTMAWSYGHGRLGIRVEDTDNDNGAKVIDVDEESAAAKAGLKENDIITEVNGKKVKDVNEVRKEVADIKDKTLITLKQEEMVQI